MKRADKVELCLIAAASLCVLCAANAIWLPRSLPLGELALVASALLLAQGLVRDLYIKFGQNRGKDPACAIGSDQKATCMCVESTLGVAGIAAGTVALFSGTGYQVTLNPVIWTLLVMTIGLAGFAMKSLVIDWKTRRIRREHDHSALRLKNSK